MGWKWHLTDGVETLGQPASRFSVGSPATMPVTLLRRDLTRPADTGPAHPRISPRARAQTGRGRPIGAFTDAAPYARLIRVG